MMVAFALFWVPVGIIIFSGVLHGFDAARLRGLYSLLPALIAGLPLAGACWTLWSEGTRNLWWILFLLLAPITIIATLAGGLFGPLGMIAFATVVSLPAWGAVSYRKLSSRRG